ncbi:MAG TPA: hypothetical protein DCF84_05725 [Bacteroidetes bacterium]|nr:hypothetical protein [Bacteroidota bacterium]|tara:strand:- start:312 stop:1811 length:1500 start_codon:yes stop_codon:yes gene_type:complete
MIRRILLSLALVFFAIQLANRIFLIIEPSPDLGGVETTFVHGVQSIQHHGTLYKNPEKPPYEFFQYHPLYFYTVALLVDKEDDPVLIYRVGRSLNLLFNLLTIALLALFMRHQLSIEKYLSWAIALLAFSLFWSHNIAVRPDSLKTLWLVASASLLWKYLLVNYDSKNEQRIVNSITSFFPIALCSTLAFATKQDGILAMGIFPLTIWVALGFSRAFVLGLMMLLSNLLFVLLLSSISPLYWTNAWLGLNQGLSLPWLRYMASFHHLDLLLYGGWLVAWVIGFVRLRTNDTRKKIWLTFTIPWWVLGVWMMLKWGSTPVYLMEAILFMLLSTAWLIQDCPRLYNVLLLSMVLFSVFWYSQGNSMSHRFAQIDRYDHLQEEALRKRKLADYLKNQLHDKESVLSFDKALNVYLYPNLYWSTYEAEYPNGMDCEFQFPFGPRKIFSLDSLHTDLAQGKLPYVISRPCSRIGTMLDLEQYDYHCTDTLYGYFLYTPYSKVTR